MINHFSSAAFNVLSGALQTLGKASKIEIVTAGYRLGLDLNRNHASDNMLSFINQDGEVILTLLKKTPQEASN